MSKKDIVLALLVVTVWGANFTVIKLGLAGVPPMLLVALRYVVTVFPAVFFIKRPAADFKYWATYGFMVGVGQFGCLFYAMYIGMPAGISSVVLQSQAIFTIVFASFALKESMKANQVIGLLIASGGLYFVGVSSSAAGITGIPAGALLLTIAAAAFWGGSNIVVRFAAQNAASKGKKLDMLSLVVWSSLVPPIPMAGMALLVDTPKTLMHALLNMNAMSVFAVLFLAFFATLLGYGIWGHLMTRYPAAKVAPISLLVPLTGLLTAWIVLSEKLSMQQWGGGAVIILGIAISNFGRAPLRKIFNRRAV